MNPSKTYIDTGDRIQKNIISINNRYVFFLLKGLSPEREIEYLEKQLKKEGFLKVDELSMQADSVIDQGVFKRLMQKAINLAAELKGFILLSHFKPFEKDTCLPAMRILSNSGVDFRVNDFPALNKEGFEVIVETYTRRKRSGRRESNSSARLKNASLNLNKEEQKLKTKRKKLQSVYLDINNQITIKELIRINYDTSIYTDTALAKHLTLKNILTPRGNFHTQKSVSRIKLRLAELDNRFKYSLSHAHSINKPLDVLYMEDRFLVTKVYKKNKDENNEAPLKKLPQQTIINPKSTTKPQYIFQLISEIDGAVQSGKYLFDENIIIDFKDQWDEITPISIKISSSIAGEEKFTFKINEPLPQRFIIPIKDTFLLPGIHLFELEVEGYESEQKVLFIMNSLNPREKEQDKTWENKLKKISQMS